MDSSTQVLWEIQRCPSLALRNPVIAWHNGTASRNQREQRCLWHQEPPSLNTWQGERGGEKKEKSTRLEEPGRAPRLETETRGPAGENKERNYQRPFRQGGEGAKWSWCLRRHGRVSLCGAGPFPSPGTFGGFLQDAGNFPTLARSERCLLSQEEKGSISFSTCCQTLSVVFQNFNVWCWSLNPFITQKWSLALIYWQSCWALENLRLPLKAVQPLVLSRAGYGKD